MGEDDIAESRVDERFEMAFLGTCRREVRDSSLQTKKEKSLTAYTDGRSHIDFESSMLRQLIAAHYFDGAIDGRHDRVSSCRVLCGAICSVKN